MDKIEIKNGRIHWVCLADKCPQTCCGSLDEEERRTSFFGIRGNMIPLTQKDYTRLVTNGCKDYLIQSEDGGWYIKTAVDGTCPFLENNRCSVYHIGNPSLCKAYPFLFTEYSGLGVDATCPGWGEGWTDIGTVKMMVEELIKVHMWQISKTRAKLELDF